MKYKLFKQGDEYYLGFSTEEMIMLTDEQVREFIYYFDTFEIDKPTDSALCKQAGQQTRELLASIGNDRTLTLYSSAFLSNIFFDESAYIGVQEYAEKHGKKRAIVSRLCNDGRIPGVVQKGTKWYIPKNAPYPKDCRAGRDMSKRYAHKKENNT